MKASRQRECEKQLLRARRILQHFVLLGLHLLDGAFLILTSSLRAAVLRRRFTDVVSPSGCIDRAFNSGKRVSPFSSSVSSGAPSGNGFVRATVRVGSEPRRLLRLLHSLACALVYFGTAAQVTPRLLVDEWALFSELTARAILRGSTSGDEALPTTAPVFALRPASKRVPRRGDLGTLALRQLRIPQSSSSS